MRQPACVDPRAPSAPQARRSPAALPAQTRGKLMVAVRAFRVSAQSRAGQPMTTVDNQPHTVNKIRRVGTNKNRRLFDIGNASKTSERNLFAQTILDRFRNQAC